MTLSRILVTAAVLTLSAMPALALDTFDLGGAGKGTPSVVTYTFAGMDAVAAFVTGPGDLMYAEVGTNDGANWTGWAPIGKQALKGSPSCVARSASRIDCVGVSANNAVFWTSYDAKKNAWTGWTSLGGYATSDPSAVRTIEGGKALLRVFVRGPADHLFLNTLAGGKWSDWQDLEGTTGTLLSCTDIFVSGAHCYDTSNGKALQLTDITNKTGNDVEVEDLGGIISGKASAVATNGGNALHVFVNGPGKRLWVKTWDVGWSDWTQLPTTVISAPGCAAEKSGDVFWCADVEANGAVKMVRLDAGDL